MQGGQETLVKNLPANAGDQETLVKNLPANAGDQETLAQSLGGKIPGGGNGNPLQYSCLENPVDREAWQVAPRGHKESDTTKVS